MNTRSQLFILLMLTASWLCSCSADPKHPIKAIIASLNDLPSCSIILDDMKIEGSIVKAYYHKYRIIKDTNSKTTDWLPVSKNDFQQYQPYLDMTIWSKNNWVVSEAIGPAGYEYVGNPQYGHWQTGPSGMSFWVFYGQYRLLSDLLGGGRIYRSDYDGYNTHRSQKRPYYGSKNQYGTSGSYTKTKKDNFYTRKMAASKSSFSSRVKERIGRTKTGFRGRSGRIGK
jgi:hypothetical protein